MASASTWSEARPWDRRGVGFRKVRHQPFDHASHPFATGKIVSGEILFDGQDLLKLPEAEMRAIRGKRIGMVFQDPMSSLNPFMRISKQLMEITELHLRQAPHGKRGITQSEMLDLGGYPRMLARESTVILTNSPAECASAS